MKEGGGNLCDLWSSLTIFHIIYFIFPHYHAVPFILSSTSTTPLHCNHQGVVPVHEFFLFFLNPSTHYPSPPKYPPSPDYILNVLFLLWLKITFCWLMFKNTTVYFDELSWKQFLVFLPLICFGIWHLAVFVLDKAFRISIWLNYSIQKEAKDQENICGSNSII